MSSGRPTTTATDSAGTPLAVGDCVQFGPLRLRVVGLIDRGEYASCVQPAEIRRRIGGVLLRTAGGELLHFGAPELHLRRITSSLAASGSAKRVS